MYVGILVKRLGYKVFLTLDGMEAIRVAKEQKPTIIVLDYSIPKLNGISCLSMIRSDALLTDTPVIMLGPEDNSLSKKDIDAMDIQGYLSKPLNVNDFYVAIQKCLRHSVKRRNIRASLSIKVMMSWNGKEMELSASNLSVEGIFVRSSSPVPQGQEVSLVLSVDDEDPIELKGIVVSSHRISGEPASEPGMGIKFRDIPEDIKYRLHYFVMKELTRDISVGEAGNTWFDDSLSA
jgi:DNA-binding response OmpR family regulator